MPTRSRSAYLRQAAFIAAGIALTFAAGIYVAEYEGSFLLLIASAIGLGFACGPPMMTTMNILSAIVGGLEGIAVIFGLVLMIALLPFIACIFLVTTLVQAARAEE